MPRRPSQHPTEAELEVLNVLWRRGLSTVRQVHEELQADRSTSLTTTLKLLQVMTDKGLTRRNSEIYPHRYRAAKAKEKTQAGLLADLAARAFDGSLGKLLVRAVEDGDLDADELKRVRKLIRDVNKTEGDRK